MCKTYCMIYSRDKEENDKIYYYDAPIYEYCGPDRVSI